MVQQQLGSAVASALKSGYDRTAIIRMVTTEIETQAIQDLPDESAEVVHDALPEGLIDLPSACRKYGVNAQTANGWWRKHDITHCGKLKGASRGGGFNVTLEKDFARMARRPVHRGGRPRKTA